jgi:hypothetical protein
MHNNAERSADKLVTVLEEYAVHHDAEVMAGERTWLIQPPVGFYSPSRPSG